MDNTSQKRLVRSKSGLRMVTADGQDANPFLLMEPEWVPDEKCDYCTSCRGKFDFLRRRRHHCRRCGRCYCDSCCNTRLALPRMCFVDPVRHCKLCSETTKKENDFFEKHIKILTNGGDFLLVKEETGTQIKCKLSPDHRFLLLEAESDETESIKFSDLESLQIMAKSQDREGNTLASGVALKYKNPNGTMDILKMTVTTGVNKKQAENWIAALQMAFKLMHEGRLMLKK